MNSSTTPISSKAITTRINMKSAHKLAKWAMICQSNDSSGNLNYSDFLAYYLSNPIVPVAATTKVSKEVAAGLAIKETIAYSFVAVMMILIGMLPNIDLANALVENGYLSSDLKIVGLVVLSIVFNLLIVGIVKGSDILMNNEKEVA